MPQIIIFALVGAAVIAGYKILKREMARVDEQLSSVRKAAEPAKPATLVKGPDGVYRPAQD